MEKFVGLVPFEALLKWQGVSVGRWEVLGLILGKKRFSIGKKMMGLFFSS